MIAYLNYILNAINMLFVLGIGADKRWGWILAIVVQPVWFAYGVQTTEYGFCIAAVVYALLNVRGLVNWSKRHAT